MKRRFWTEAELEIVRAKYADVPTARLAAELGRTVLSVYQAAFGMGLGKSAAFMASPAACRLRRGDNVGAATRFNPGHVPANKGTRRPGWAPGRMAETQFRKGERRGAAAHHWCPIGTIRVDDEGYLRIKVREREEGEAFGFGNTKIWPLLHRHVWAQQRGPVPAGHALVFKDRDRANCAIENLELITRAELLRRNSVHRWGPEVFEVIQLRGALNRKLRRLSEKQNAGSAQPPVRDAGNAEGRDQADGPGPGQADQRSGADDYQLRQG